MPPCSHPLLPPRCHLARGVLLSGHVLPLRDPRLAQDWLQLALRLPPCSHPSHRLQREKLAARAGIEPATK